MFNPLPNYIMLFLQIKSTCRRQNLKKKKINVTEKLKFVVENTVGNTKENAGYQHFLLCTQCLQMGLFLCMVKSRDCQAKFSFSALFSGTHNQDVQHF